MNDETQVQTEETAAATPRVRAVREEQNGQTKPLSGVTRYVWDTADRMSGELGRPVLRKELFAQLVTNEGYDPSTVATQYGRWTRFNGITAEERRSIQYGDRDQLAAERAAQREAEKAEKAAAREAEKAAKAAEREAAKAAKEAEKEAARVAKQAERQAAADERARAKAEKDAEKARLREERAAAAAAERERKAAERALAQEAAAQERARKAEEARLAAAGEAATE